MRGTSSRIQPLGKASHSDRIIWGWTIFNGFYNNFFCFSAKFYVQKDALFWLKIRDGQRWKFSNSEGFSKLIKIKITCYICKALTFWYFIVRAIPKNKVFFDRVFSHRVEMDVPKNNYCQKLTARSQITKIWFPSSPNICPKIIHNINLIKIIMFKIINTYLHRNLFD